MKYDIIIVGANFAGLTLAHYLPRNLRVLLLERKKDLDTGVETTGLITRDTYDLFADFMEIQKFIPNEITTLGVIGPDYQNHFFSQTKTPWIYATDTANLIKHLAETLPKNVDLELNSRFINHEITANSEVIVNFRQTGETKKIRGKFIVGADGAGSTVAKVDTKLSQNKKNLVGLEKVYEGEILFGKNPAKTVYHYWFGEFSLGYGGWLSPTIIDDKKAVRIGFAQNQKQSSSLEKVDEFMQTLVAKKMIKLNNEKPLFQFASLIPVGGILPKISHNHAMLIGDAAGLCGSFAADGIKGAILSAKIAADLIPRHLAGEKNVLQNLYPEMQKHNRLISYYRKQLFYRWGWNLMKNNRTFDTLLSILSRSSDDFLNHFCASKDQGKSLLGLIFKLKNFKLLVKFSWYIFLDLFKK